VSLEPCRCGALCGFFLSRFVKKWLTHCFSNLTPHIAGITLPLTIVGRIEVSTRSYLFVGGAFRAVWRAGSAGDTSGLPAGQGLPVPGPRLAGAGSAAGHPQADRAGRNYVPVCWVRKFTRGISDDALGTRPAPGQTAAPTHHTAVAGTPASILRRTGMTLPSAGSSSPVVRHFHDNNRGGDGRLHHA
jgi:hypothetical protein